jgi:hypothetical protein
MPDVVQSALWSITNAEGIGGQESMDAGRELLTFQSWAARAG